MSTQLPPEYNKPVSERGADYDLVAENARAIQRVTSVQSHINPIVIHFLIVLTIVTATVVICLTEHGELPTSVGGLFGAALGISATNVAHKANGDK